ncbi:hypothetical protein DAI22_02g007750 [Oryza sativa Japonica Group]|nr:hypothetical protein DAI22_02g007750 [Oryza sativa Japonica Group]
MIIIHPSIYIAHLLASIYTHTYLHCRYQSHLLPFIVGVHIYVGWIMSHRM